MEHDRLSGVCRALHGVLAAAAVAYVAVYFGIAVLRVAHPFELEWMEGGILDGVRRITAGEPLYVPPSVDFVPYAYPPLYHWLSAAVAQVTGLGFLPLRLVSLLSSLGSFAVIFLLVRRETGSPRAGVLAAGLFAATFSVSGGWFDIARIDSLGVFTMLAAIGLARTATTARAAALAAAAFALSFFAKQLALAAAVPVLLFYLVFRRRLALPFALTLAGLVGGSTLLLDALHDGWFSFYVFSFHAGRSIDPRMLLAYVRLDLLVLDIALLAGLFYLLAAGLQRERRATAAYYLLVTGGLVGACGIARALSLGAGSNVVIPAHAILAVLFGLGAHEATAAVRAAGGGRWRFVGLFVVLALLLQLGRLVYDPRRHVPTAADRRAGERLVERIAAIDGDVFVPCHAWLPAQAGKRTFVHAVGIYDALHHERTRDALRASLLEALGEQRFAAVVLNYDWTTHGWFQRALEQGYEVAGPAFDDAAGFWPVTGVRTRPREIWRPRER